MIALLAGVAFWCAPIPLAIVFWQAATQRPQRWWLHLLFFPVLLFMEWSLLRALAFAIQDDGDGPPGTGFLYAPGFLITVAALLIYLGGLGILGAKAAYAKLRRA